MSRRTDRIAASGVGTAMLERARELMSVRSRSLVALTGSPGAGKPTVAAALSEGLGGQCQVVPMDGFHLASRLIRDDPRWERRGAPDTFDADGFRKTNSARRYANWDALEP